MTIILVFNTLTNIDDFIVLQGEKNTKKVIDDTIDALYDEYENSYDRIEILTKTDTAIITQTIYGESGYSEEGFDEDLDVENWLEDTE